MSSFDLIGAKSYSYFFYDFSRIYLHHIFHSHSFTNPPPKKKKHMSVVIDYYKCIEITRMDNAISMTHNFCTPMLMHMMMFHVPQNEQSLSNKL